MRFRDLLLEKKRAKKTGITYTCSVDAFRRNARRFEKAGYPQSLAFAQAYQALAFACERAKREASVILTSPQEGLSMDEWMLLAEGLAKGVLEC